MPRIFGEELTEAEWEAALASPEVSRALVWRRGAVDYGLSAQGRVYLLWAEGTARFKVGFTRHSVEGRASQIAVSSPFPIKVLGAVEARLADERNLHWYLRPYWRNGEWFEPPSLVLRALLFWFNCQGALAVTGLVQ